MKDVRLKNIYTKERLLKKIKMKKVRIFHFINWNYRYVKL